MDGVLKKINCSDDTSVSFANSYEHATIDDCDNYTATDPIPILEFNDTVNMLGNEMSYIDLFY